MDIQIHRYFSEYMCNAYNVFNHITLNKIRYKEKYIVSRTRTHLIYSIDLYMCERCACSACCMYGLENESNLCQRCDPKNEFNRFCLHKHHPIVASTMILQSCQVNECRVRVCVCDWSKPFNVYFLFFCFHKSFNFNDLHFTIVLVLLRLYFNKIFNKIRTNTARTNEIE